VIIRPFKDHDYPVILDIYAKSKLDELAYERTEFELLPLDQDPKRLAELQESDIYVVEDNGVIAYGALFENEIRAVFVHPHSRGRGVGKILLEYLLAKTRGAASLYVAKTNVIAHRLYEKLGFVAVEEFETLYNGVPVMALKMERVSNDSVQGLAILQKSAG